MQSSSRIAWLVWALAACGCGTSTSGPTRTEPARARATDCAQPGSCEGTTPRVATPPSAPSPCARACARAAECGIGSFESPEACQSSCESSPASAAPGHDFHAVFDCLSGVDSGQCDASRACQLRAIASLAAPEMPPGATVDARELVSPIRVLLGWRLGVPETDQAGAAVYVLVLSLVDAQNAERHIKLGTVSMPQSESIVAVEPASGQENGPLFEDHRFFAGAGDDYRVEHSRGALVVKHRGADEDDSTAQRWTQTLRIELARGADVQPRTAR